MSQAIKITAIVGAYISGTRNPADVFDAVHDPEMHAALLGSVLTYSDYDMSRTWTKVGDAEITVTMASEDAQVAAAIKALQGQLDEARAKFLQFQAETMERISKLQAITYEAQA